MSQATEIGHALEGRSDDEILAWIRSVGGYGVFLKLAFSGMKEAFHAERAAGESAVIRWDITTPDGNVIYELDVADGECTLSRGVHLDARVVLSMQLADFLRLVTGCFGGVEALHAGKLKIGGDMHLAFRLSEWFEETP